MPAHSGSYAKEKENLLRRLRRIEGQVKGIQRMIGEDQYCVDVLIQIAAVRAALNKVGMLIFDCHTRGCLQEALAGERQEEVLEELSQVLRKFMK